MKLQMILGAGALAVAIAVAGTPRAEAGLFDTFKKAVKKAQKVVKDVSRDVRKAARKAVRDAGQAIVDTAKKLGKGAAKQALHEPFYLYIKVNRDHFLRKALPLTASEKAFLAAFFPKRLINRVKVLVRAGDTGYFNKSAGATTFGNDFVIIRKGHRSNDLLKHEFVHVCQYDRFGLRGFAYRYADQYVDGGFSYRKIKFEEQAYGFEKTGKGAVSKFLRYCSR